MSSTPPVTPPATPPGQPAENATIRQMREQISSLTSQLSTEQQKAAQLEAEKVSASRAGLEELDRLKLEKADLETRVGTLTETAAYVESANATFQEIYDAELSKVEEAKRETLRTATSHGQWPERLRSLRAMTSLLDQPSTVVQIGSVTQPGSVQTPATPGQPGVAAATKPWNPAEGPPGWNEVFKPATAPGA